MVAGQKWLEIEIDFPFPKFSPCPPVRPQVSVSHLGPRDLDTGGKPVHAWRALRGGHRLGTGISGGRRENKASCQGWIVDVGRVLHNSATGFLDILGDVSNLDEFR